MLPFFKVKAQAFGNISVAVVHVGLEPHGGLLGGGLYVVALVVLYPGYLLHAVFVLHPFHAGVLVVAPDTGKSHQRKLVVGEPSVQEKRPLYLRILARIGIVLDLKVVPALCFHVELPLRQCFLAREQGFTRTAVVVFKYLRRFPAVLQIPDGAGSFYNYFLFGARIRIRGPVLLIGRDALVYGVRAHYVLVLPYGFVRHRAGAHRRKRQGHYKNQQQSFFHRQHPAPVI